jgi:hypothetical protein
MNKLIQKLLNVLKEHVNQNNREIQLNQEEIEKLLSDTTLNTHKKDLEIKYSLNRELLNENSDFVQIQLELSEFMDKYKHLFPGNASENTFKEMDEDNSQNLFKQTVSGKLKFDSAHPQYNNPGFLQELLKYYEIHENYEMCDKLIKLRKI